MTTVQCSQNNLASLRTFSSSRVLDIENVAIYWANRWQIKSRLNTNNNKVNITFTAQFCQAFVLKTFSIFAIVRDTCTSIINDPLKLDGITALRCEYLHRSEGWGAAPIVNQRPLSRARPLASSPTQWLSSAAMQTPEPLPGFIFDIENPPVVLWEQTSLGKMGKSGMDWHHSTATEEAEDSSGATVFNYKRNKPTTCCVHIRSSWG